METNTAAPLLAGLYAPSPLTGLQLPHLPSQDLPDWSPVAPLSHHLLPAFPTADVTGEQGLHPVCSRGLTSGFHPGWGVGGGLLAPCLPLWILCLRAGLDVADENRLLGILPGWLSQHPLPKDWVEGT